MRTGSAKYIVPALLIVVTFSMWEYCACTRQLFEQRLTDAGFPERTPSDLLPPWLGTRELLLDDRDPYSPEVTNEIQRGYYGRPIDASRATDPLDEQRFAYPLFVVFLLAPFIDLPFTLVRWLFTAILSASAVWTVLYGAELMGLKVGRLCLFACVLLSLATLPYAEGIQLQQLSVLVGFLLVAALFALVRGRLELAGGLLAIATIKPQLSIPLLGLLLLWSVSQWRLRRRLLVSFLTVLFTMILASEMLLPRWPFEFFAGIAPYIRYTQATTGVNALFGSMGGAAILLIFAVMTTFSIWRAKSEPVDSDGFRLASSLTLAFACIAIPSLAPHNQVILVPGYLLLLKKRKGIWARGRVARSLLCGASLTLGWPWVSGTVLAATLAFNKTISARVWDLPFVTNPLVPITLFMALMPLLLQPQGVARVVRLAEPLNAACRHSR